MKWYLALALVALILLLSSPSHQQEQRSGSSRREGEGVPRRRESNSTRPSGALLDKLRKLSKSTFKELAKEFNLNLQSVPSHKKTVRMGGAVGVVDTTPSKIYCNTKPVCVPIPQPIDGSGVNWPFCAIVPQCSGCCDLMSELLTCKPISKSNHSVEVMYIPYGYLSSRSSRSVSRRNSLIPEMVQESVEVHEQCTCACRTDPSACNENQFFKEDHCRCECKQQSRKQCTGLFQWNENECRCKCNRPRAICSSDRYWSENHCGCVCKPQSCLPFEKLNSECKCENEAFISFKKYFGRK